MWKNIKHSLCFIVYRFYSYDSPWKTISPLNSMPKTKLWFIQIIAKLMVISKLKAELLHIDKTSNNIVFVSIWSYDTFEALFLQNNCKIYLYS